MEPELKSSYELLGLKPEATLREVEVAYRELYALYGEESLATYSLFDFAERQEKLAALTEAYDALVQARICPLPEEPPAAAVPKPAVAEQPIDSDPDSEPGRYLQQHRERLGLSLQDVAERTKVGIYHLRSIEAQQLEKLPAPVYLRGFVREFARTVGVDDCERVISAFIAQMRSEDS